LNYKLQGEGHEKKPKKRGWNIDMRPVQTIICMIIEDKD
jgi:hypothetical protein